MIENENVCESANENGCNGRRDFLVSASAIAGGLVLSLSGFSGTAKADDKPEEITVKLDEKSPLNKVGGSTTLDTKAGKVVVIRTAEMAFTAVSAKCPHEGGPIKFDAKANQLFCPWHKSFFSLDGKNISGPAKTPLSSFATESAVVVSVKSKK